MFTPWGPSQYLTRSPDLPDVVWVSTAGHGGLGIARELAEQHLSAAALKRATGDGWYWFEEDIAWRIAYFEWPELERAMEAAADADWAKHRDELIALGESGDRPAIDLNHLPWLSRWYPDYLLERGIEPAPERYAQWRQHQADLAAWQQRNRELAAV
jgi:hypothetical protein